jgi:hypothetical protein
VARNTIADYRPSSVWDDHLGMIEIWHTGYGRRAPVRIRQVDSPDPAVDSPDPAVYSILLAGTKDGVAERAAGYASRSWADPRAAAAIPA